MEIEAKYTVPDEAVFEQLLARPALGSYQLRPAQEQLLLDHYLDTAERLILHGGYACRLRESAGRWRAALKSLGRSEGAVHQREEYEVDVPPDAQPSAWPPGPARDLALQLSQGRPLIELCVIRQRRAERGVWQGQRHAATLSLDVTEIVAGERPAFGRELEIELAPGGAVEDLRALEHTLGDYGLRPQPRSKFERALALLDSHQG
jgi:inorganic triphosphatase YgiF